MLRGIDACRMREKTAGEQLKRIDVSEQTVAETGRRLIKVSTSHKQGGPKALQYLLLVQY